MMKPKSMNNETSNQTASAPASSLERLIRPDPLTFQNFPPNATCPICGTNDDGKTVLVQISGTVQGEIAEATPMHLACAVAKQWDEGMGIALTWPNVPALAQSGGEKTSTKESNS